MTQNWEDDRRLITLPSQIAGVRRYTDNGAGVTFRSTLEVSVDDMAVLDSFLRDKTVGQLAFAANRIDLGKLPKEDAATDERKSQSAVIRGLLWHIWDKNTDHSEDAEAYIRRRRARLIDALKDELDG